MEALSMNVIENIQKAQVARKRNETSEELGLIQERIDHIMKDYELSQEAHTSPSNIEFLADMKELEEILSDSVLKAKYQQKVTVFLIGFQKQCTTRKNILSQLFEFFDTYSTPVDSDDLGVLDVDLDNSHLDVTNAIDIMEHGTSKLSELNVSIMAYIKHLHQVAANKKNKNLKKLEKAINTAKNDLAKVSDKLMEANQVIANKEDTINILNKQMDSKNKEIVKLKGEINKAKRDSKLTKESLLEAEHSRDLTETQLQFTKTKLNDEINMLKDQYETSISGQISAVVKEHEMKLSADAEELKLLNDLELSVELQKSFCKLSSQVEELQNEEREKFISTYKQTLQQLLEIEVTDDDVKKWSGRQDEEDDQQMHQEDEEDDDVDTNEVHDQPQESNEEFNQKEEEDLDNLSADEIREKFKAYREMTESKMQTTTPMNSSGFEEERMKWEVERERYLKHIDQLKVLQEAAEMDAEEAMQQLEDLARIQDAEQQAMLQNGVPSVIITEKNGDEQMRSQQQMNDEDIRDASSNEIDEAKPLSSNSKRSLASMLMEKVEEKRAARLKRQKSLTNIITSTSQTSDVATNTSLTAILDAVSDLQAKMHDVYGQTETQTDNKATSTSERILEITRELSNLVEVQPQVSQRDVSSAHVSQHNIYQEHASPQPLSNGDLENDTQMLRLKVSQLERDLESTRFTFEQRVHHDSQTIKQLQSSISARHERNSVPNPTPLTTVYNPLDGAGDAPPRTSASTILFTRLDVEHNTKTLKKSQATGKLTPGVVSSLVTSMQAYNAIPAMRMRHLASKLVHHVKMKEVEMNVRNSNLVTAEVFMILEKMEALQRHRAHEWSRHMDELGRKRVRLATLLQDAMMRLENTTGVFLIKPILSYHNPQSKKYTGKISTNFNKYQMQAQEKNEKNMPQRVDEYRQMLNSTNRPPTNQETFSVFGLAQTEDPPVWNKDASVVISPRSDKTNRITGAFPRILELDVNRYLHEINTVITSPTYKKASRGSLRTYTGIGRANVSTSPIKTDVVKVSPNESADYQSTAPPTTPASLARNLNSVSSLLQQPLPPIMRNDSRASSGFSTSPVKSPQRTPSPEKNIQLRRSSVKSEIIQVFRETSITG